MPIEKREASKLCRKYLASLPDFADRDRADVIIESLVEVCHTTYQAQKTLAVWRAANRSLPTYADLLEIADQTPLNEPTRSHCEKCGGTGWLVVDALITMEPRKNGREFRRVERITEQQARQLQQDDEFRKVQARGDQMLNTGAERCSCGAALVARVTLPRYPRINCRNQPRGQTWHPRFPNSLPSGSRHRLV